MENLKEPLIHWLSYVQLKYPTTSKLELKATDMAQIPTIHEMEKLVISIISNMPNLTSYAIDFHPLSKQLATIKSLTIRDLFLQLDERVFTYALRSLARQLPNLKELNVYSILTQNIYVDILQDLSNRDKSTVESPDIPKDYDDDDLESRVIFKKSKIKHLHIGTYSEEPGDMDQINTILKFTLQSCPALQHFTLAGEFSCKSPDTIKLHFTNHPNIKHIKVDLDNNNHYTFSKVPEKNGKKYLGDKTLVAQPFKDVLYHTDIFWKGEVDTLMILIKAIVSILSLFIN